MKISQLIATKKYTQYHESVASRLPRGIKSQQQLLNFGYGIAVRDLGLLKASSLNENFAAKLVNSYHKQCLDEGIGSFLGKAAGNVAGAVGAAGRGLKGAWQDAKQGYSNAKAAWDPKDAPGTYPNAASPAPAGAAPAPGAATGAPAPAADPAATGAPAAEPAAPATGDVSSIMKTIDKLDKPTKQQLAGELQKNIASAPEPEAEKPGYDPQTGVANASMAAQNSAAGKAAAPHGFNPQTGEPNPDPAAPPAEPQGSTYDPEKAAADKAAKNQADADQRNADIEKTKQANAAKNQQDAAIKAAADAAKAKPAFQQTASDKLAIQAADKAGIREAKKKLKKKIVAEFKSNFLGKII
jgi:hypothetical protein